MSATNRVGDQNGKRQTRGEEMMHLIESRDWSGLDKLVGFSPEEVERILREEPMIDAVEVNRRMEELDRTDERASSGNCQK
jgi:hypothetical protein